MKFPNAVRAVIFDMDGLLVDTERLLRDVMIDVASAFGRELPEAIFHSMIGTTYETSDAILQGHFGAGFDLKTYFEEVERLRLGRLRVGAALKTGVVELLDHLDEQRLPRAICTSSSQRAVREHLGPHGLVERFDAVIARGDYERGKPAPDPYLAAAARLGAAPEACLALEDSHNGVRAAHAAGMMTVMVPDLLEPNEEMRGRCIAIATSLHEVRRALEAAVV